VFSIYINIDFGMGDDQIPIKTCKSYQKLLKSKKLLKSIRNTLYKAILVF